MGILWLMGLLGCTGGDPTDPTDGTGDTEGTTPPDPCDGVPVYDDISDFGCSELTGGFTSAVRTAFHCERAADCRVIHPRCEMWSGISCYYAVNDCLSDSQITEFGAQAAQLDCRDPSGWCECGAAPEADCINQRCELVFDY